MANNYSRWETTKNNSNWHFDPSRPPTPGADSYTYVGNFKADFTAAIARAETHIIPNNWGSKFIRDPAVAITAEQADLIKVGADKDVETYDRAPGNNIPLFHKCANALGMDLTMIKFHIQRTGQYAVTHIDNYVSPTHSNWRWLQKQCNIEPNGADRDVSVRRFAIMLEDWQMGQVFQVGNATWSNWRAGDCITWDWYNMPHATANIGWRPRPMLQLTGAETDATRRIVTDANLGKYLHVDLTFSS